MLNFLRSPEAVLGASAGLIVIVSALVGQYAARGMTPTQWVYGLSAVAGSITLAVILRCWPAEKAAVKKADDEPFY
jgi:hypothetical protein